MKLSVHQPDYFPYLGSFYTMYLSEEHVFLDDAQFTTSGMNHWNRIKTVHGEARIKIPIDYHFGDAIYGVRTKDALGWREQHIKIVESNYRNAKYFSTYYPLIRELILADFDNLAQRNVEICKRIADLFGISCKFHLASQLPRTEKKKEDRLIELCKYLNKTVYVSGIGARAYQSEEHFQAEDLALRYTDYVSFEYPQQWGGFIANLSVIDYIFNCGFDWDKALKEVTNALKRMCQRIQ